MNLPLAFFLLFILLSFSKAWELELYDLVEELDVDFYTLLGVERTADSKLIRQAFKKLSLVLHPDKNSAEDADVKFRQLVAVHEVLRDPEKRARYEEVLENGLPDWRHAVYYYRRVRKMGMVEMLTILFGIVTVGQYLVGWASYFEKKFIIDELLTTQRKRLLRKQKKGKIDELPEMSVEIPMPSICNTLPFQIPKLVWRSIIGTPAAIYSLLLCWKEWKTRPPPKEESDEEPEEPIWTKRPRKRKQVPLPEGKRENGEVPKEEKRKEEPIREKVVSGGLWTDENLLELIRLVKKYPTGVPQRWERIAEQMNRSVAEVTKMAKKIEDGLTVRCEPEEPLIFEEKVKEKTKGAKVEEADGVNSEWNQIQQKALEEALVKFPKNVGERWDRIARMVPGKTKEECMMRYKYLAETLKRRKEESSDRN